MFVEKIMMCCISKKKKKKKKIAVRVKIRSKKISFKEIRIIESSIKYNTINIVIFHSRRTVYNDVHY
jgi:hypothetical protein